MRKDKSVVKDNEHISRCGCRPRQSILKWSGVACGLWLVTFRLRHSSHKVVRAEAGDFIDPTSGGDGRLSIGIFIMSS
jgi:hypothetical protein